LRRIRSTGAETAVMLGRTGAKVLETPPPFHTQVGTSSPHHIHRFFLQPTDTSVLKFASSPLQLLFSSGTDCERSPSSKRDPWSPTCIQCISHSAAMQRIEQSETGLPQQGARHILLPVPTARSVLSRRLIFARSSLDLSRVRVLYGPESAKPHPHNFIALVKLPEACLSVQNRVPFGL
jgi:hypothetical protein